MKTCKSILKKILKIESLILLISTIIYTNLISNISFNGGTILMLMLMFTLDIKNLYKTKKQTINSMSYYLLNIPLLGIVTFYIIKSFILLFTSSENTSSLFFYNHLLISYIITLISIISQYFYKKTITSDFPITINKVLFITILLSMIPLFSNSTTIMMGVNIAIIVFSIIKLLFLKFASSIELDIIYLILLILCIVVTNPVSVVLFINYFIEQTMAN